MFICPHELLYVVSFGPAAQPQPAGLFPPVMLHVLMLHLILVAVHAAMIGPAEGHVHQVGHRPLVTRRMVVEVNVL